MKAKQIIQRSAAPADDPSAIAELVDLIAEATHGVQPVVRLWGNRGGLEGQERSRFETIGEELGRCVAERRMALSGSMIQPNTLEFWALKGALDHLAPRPCPIPFYLHFNGIEAPYIPGDAERLYRTAADGGSIHMLEIKYPQHDSYYQNSVNDEIAYEKSSAHDARLGSLFQCDAVVLLGGSHSARHLVQMLAFLAQNKMRVSKPVLFLPLPWVGGTARKAFNAYHGIVEELDFSALL